MSPGGTKHALEAFNALQRARSSERIFVFFVCARMGGPGEPRGQPPPGASRRLGRTNFFWTVISNGRVSPCPSRLLPYAQPRCNVIPCDRGGACLSQGTAELSITGLTHGLARDRARGSVMTSLPSKIIMKFIKIAMRVKNWVRVTVRAGRPGVGPASSGVELLVCWITIIAEGGATRWRRPWTRAR